MGFSVKMFDPETLIQEKATEKNVAEIEAELRPLLYSFLGVILFDPSEEKEREAIADFRRRLANVIPSTIGEESRPYAMPKILRGETGKISPEQDIVQKTPGGRDELVIFLLRIARNLFEFGRIEKNVQGVVDFVRTQLEIPRVRKTRRILSPTALLDVARLTGVIEDKKTKLNRIIIGICNQIGILYQTKFGVTRTDGCYAHHLLVGSSGVSATHCEMTDFDEPYRIETLLIQLDEKLEQERIPATEEAIIGAVKKYLGLGD